MRRFDKVVLCVQRYNKRSGSGANNNATKAGTSREKSCEAVPMHKMCSGKHMHTGNNIHHAQPLVLIMCKGAT